jgi:hypothetical protein
MDTVQKNLRIVMNANAAFSGLSGLIMTLFAGPVAGYLGVEAGANYILIIGLGLIAFAAFMIVNNNRAPLSPGYVLAIIAADSLWVLASLVLLIGGWIPFSLAGRWTVGLLALVVDVFATLQFFGWRRLPVRVSDGEHGLAGR